MGDTKAAFSELWASLRVALVDACGLFEKRWPIYVGIVIASGLVDLGVITFTPLKVPVFGWVAGSTALSFYLSYDVLRLKQPAFRYTFAYIARLFGASFALFFVWLITFIILNYTTWMLTQQFRPVILTIDVILAYLPLTRFVFVGYLLAEPIRETNSFALSWSLTGGSMSFPTMALCLLSNLATIPLFAAVNLLPAAVQTWLDVFLDIGVYAVLFPLILRWMQACIKALGEQQAASLSELLLAPHD